LPFRQHPPSSLYPTQSFSILVVFCVSFILLSRDILTLLCPRLAVLLACRSSDMLVVMNLDDSRHEHQEVEGRLAEYLHFQAKQGSMPLDPLHCCAFGLVAMTTVLAFLASAIELHHLDDFDAPLLVELDSANRFEIMGSSDAVNLLHLLYLSKCDWSRRGLCCWTWTERVRAVDDRISYICFVCGIEGGRQER
ncbi:hypothetical protein BDZ45DRAFT_330143, partial [Acephala macrosclerotiorum]